MSSPRLGCLHVTFIDDEKYFHFDPFYPERNLCRKELKSTVDSVTHDRDVPLMVTPYFSCSSFLEATTATLATTRTTDNRARCRLKLSKIQRKHFPLITSRHRHSQPLNQQNVNVVSLCDAGAALRSRRRGTKTLFRWNSSAEFRGMLGLLCVTDLLHRRLNVARWLPNELIKFLDPDKTILHSNELYFH